MSALYNYPSTLIFSSSFVFLKDAQTLQQLCASLAASVSERFDVRVSLDAEIITIMTHLIVTLA